MTVRGWRALAVSALAAMALTGCGEGIHSPWLSDGEAESLGSELDRGPETAKALDHRLKHRVAGYGNY